MHLRTECIIYHSSGMETMQTDDGMKVLGRAGGAVLRLASCACRLGEVLHKNADA